MQLQLSPTHLQGRAGHSAAQLQMVTHVESTSSASTLSAERLSVATVLFAEHASATGKKSTAAVIRFMMTLALIRGAPGDA